VSTEPERRCRVRDRALSLRRRLQLAGLAVPAGSSQIVPVVLGSNTTAMAVAAALQQDGFDVRAIRPPSVPAGKARLRVSVNAGLSESTLDRFVEALEAAVREAALC
jgi:8-amino-7-oxononanoate synthase